MSSGTVYTDMAVMPEINVTRFHFCLFREILRLIALLIWLKLTQDLWMWETEFLRVSLIRHHGSVFRVKLVCRWDILKIPRFL